MRARLRAAHGRPGLVVGSHSRSRGVRRRCLHRKCHRAARGSAFTHSFPLSFFSFSFFIFSFYFLTGNRIGLALLADHPAIPPARFRSGRTRAAPHMSAQLRLSSARQELEAAYAGPCPGDGRIASAMPGPGRPCSAAPLNRASATRSAEVRIILRKDVRVSGGP